MDSVLENLGRISATLDQVVNRLNQMDSRISALETANVAHVAAALPNVSLKGLKPTIKDYIGGDMGQFFTKYSNWLLPQTVDNRQRKYMLFCEVSNGQTTRNVQQLFIPSNDDSIEYDQFVSLMKEVFCPPNASLLSQRCYYAANRRFIVIYSCPENMRHESGTFCKVLCKFDAHSFARPSKNAPTPPFKMTSPQNKASTVLSSDDSTFLLPFLCNANAMCPFV